MQNGTRKTYLQLRQEACDNIIDEAVFIARASEGAITLDWIMNQPISVRKKYVDSLQKELEERMKELEK